MDEAAADNDEYALIEADKDFHIAIFRAAGLDALEQILVRCIMHSHRCKLWAPGHRRPLAETAARHDVLIELLAAAGRRGAGEGPGRAYRHHRPARGPCGGRGMKPYVHPEMAVILEELRAQPAVDFKAMPIAQARRQSDAASMPWTVGAPDIPAVEVEVPGSSR